MRYLKWRFLDYFRNVLLTFILYTVLQLQIRGRNSEHGSDRYGGANGRALSGLYGRYHSLLVGEKAVRQEYIHISGKTLLP